MFSFSYVLAQVVDFFRTPKGRAFLIAGVLAIIALTQWNSYQKEKKEALEDARFNCRYWIDREHNDLWLSEPAIVTDTWEKNGHSVIKVAWPSERGSGLYRSRLCVVDLKTGKMFSPWAFSRSRWDKF